MMFAIVVFPGSNCDHDVYHVAKHVLGRAARYIWHKDRDLRGADVVVLPGGFSYGDYLRTGAIARFSPVMEEVKKFANRGGHVIGICNGFQILLEAGLLPGAMRRDGPHPDRSRRRQLLHRRRRQETPRRSEPDRLPLCLARRHPR